VQPGASPSTRRPAAVSVFPYVLVLACGVLWGMTFSLARIAASNAAHPVGLAFWQALGGGLVLLAYCLLRRRRPPLHRAGLRHALVIALFGTSIPASLFFYAAPQVPAGVLAITVALVPMLTYALSWMLGIERLNRRRSFGIGLGFAAIVLLVAPDTSLPDPAMAGWLALPLVASVFYTLENVYVDVSVPQNTDMAGLLTTALIIAAATLWPVMMAAGAFHPLSLPLDDADLALIGMMVVSSAAYVMFLSVVKMAGAVFASVIGYVITLAGVFWGLVFFAERHSPWVWAALALMLAGMLLVRPRRSVPDLGAHG